MNKSEFLELNLPSRDNTDDIADINAISDNFKKIDDAFLDIVEKELPKYQTKNNLINAITDNSSDDNLYPSVPAVSKYTKEKVEPLKIVNSASGNAISLKDSAKDKLKGLKLYGKTTQNGTPTPSAPVPLVSVGDSGSFIVKIQGENVAEQILTMPYTLRSVGEVKDEVDFNRGVLIQRIRRFVLNGSENWRQGSSAFFYVPNNNTNLGGSSLWSHFPQGSGLVSASSNGIYITQSSAVLGATLNELKTNLANSNLVVDVTLKTPIETELPETELNAYRQLHTNKPNTTILSEAEMEVDYVADPKLYIDNKIAELTALTLEV